MIVQQYLSLNIYTDLPDDSALSQVFDYHDFLQLVSWPYRLIYWIAAMNHGDELPKVVDKSQADIDD